MTDKEKEEFVYDLANHYVERTSKAGLVAMAIDRMVDMLIDKDIEELIEIAPSSALTNSKMLCLLLPNVIYSPAGSLVFNASTSNSLVVP